MFKRHWFFLWYNDLQNKIPEFPVSVTLPFSLKGAKLISCLAKGLVKDFWLWNWGVFMRPFYIDKNSNGYYRVRFVDRATGIISNSKSTHTKKYDEALVTVLEWQKNGIPSGRIDARVHGRQTIDVKSKITLDSFTKQLSNITISAQQAETIITFLAKKAETSPALNRMGKSVPEVSDGSSPAPIHTKTDTFESKGFCTYLMDFWTPEKSGYIQDRREHGHGCTERYCHDMRGIVTRYFIPVFGQKNISCISPDILDSFFMRLKKDQGLSAASVNKVINCCNVAYKYAKKKHWIANNPIEEIEKFTIRSRERGIPTDSEVARLFRLDWTDPVCKLANMIGAFCGMRIGEIQALQVCDVEKNVIHIRHGWNTKDGLKCTKNGITRDVPVPAEISAALLDHAKGNRFYGEKSFIFFSRKTETDKPLVFDVFENALYEAYHRIGISENMRLERNLVFHSWRHYYAKKMTDLVKLEQAQQALGHLTPEMTQHYADHRTKQDFEVLEKAMNDTYSHIINFPETETA